MVSRSSLVVALATVAAAQPWPNVRWDSSLDLAMRDSVQTTTESEAQNEAALEMVLALAELIQESQEYELDYGMKEAPDASSVSTTLPYTTQAPTLAMNESTGPPSPNSTAQAPSIVAPNTTVVATTGAPNATSEVKTGESNPSSTETTKRAPQIVLAVGASVGLAVLILAAVLLKRHQSKPQVPLVDSRPNK
ncbi:hypothetical protein AeNC1_002710 [Aphanomyces euteiches]|nr:hypothetical protein AeNC1_002710 [Aphanomyces euteiches]